MPDLYIIAGCNGAGKTTGSFVVLPEMLNCKEFVNADIIAYKIAPLNQESIAFEAGRIMLNRIEALLQESADFAFETTLSTKSFVPLIKKAKSLGYKITLLFFWLSSPQMARNRVATRVAKGGHAIPADVVERRYYRGIKNLHELYMPICDNWIIVNNTVRAKPIASKINGTTQIIDYKIWNMITEQIPLAKEPETVYGKSSDLVARIMSGLHKAYNQLVIESAARNESLVVEIDGEVKYVPARKLARLLNNSTTNDITPSR